MTLQLAGEKTEPDETFGVWKFHMKYVLFYFN